jgi:hypothetical protein
MQVLELLQGLALMSSVVHKTYSAIEDLFHLNSMHREVGFCLSKSWKPLILSLKKPPEYNARSTRLCRLMHAQQLSPKAIG